MHLAESVRKLTKAWSMSTDETNLVSSTDKTNFRCEEVRSNTKHQKKKKRPWSNLLIFAKPTSHFDLYLVDGSLELKLKVEPILMAACPT